jgi:xylulokinase
MAVVGIDVGTTGCKASIVGERGSVLCSAYREYPPAKSREGIEEIDPNVVWEQVVEIIRVLARSETKDPVRAVSVSSLGEAFVALDRAGNCLTNSPLYTDKRGDQALQSVVEKLGRDRILSITGAVPHTMYSLSKLLWMKHDSPDIYSRLWKVLPYSAFILFRLGAEPHADYSLAARTLAFDVVGNCWSGDILRHAEIEESKFPRPVPPGTEVGILSRSSREQLGLKGRIRLISGAHDQVAAALGAGVTAPRHAVDGMGTVECITPVFDSPANSKRMADFHFACVPHAVKGKYVTYAFNFTSGEILKWFKNNFCREEAEYARSHGTSVYDLIVQSSAPGPSELFLLPHFAGAATPYMDSASRGALIGLTHNTTKAEIAKAILEGTTYEMMVNIECLSDAGIGIDSLHAVGGGSNSERWLQLKANMMGKEVMAMNVSEAGILGTAMMAGTAIGLFSDLSEAASILVKPRRTFWPDKDVHESYREKFDRYKKVYPAVKSVLSG